MRRMQFACFATGTAAVLLSGVLAWKACMFGTTRCAAGTKWMCVKGSNANGDTKKCKCRAC